MWTQLKITAQRAKESQWDPLLRERSVNGERAQEAPVLRQRGLDSVGRGARGAGVETVSGRPSRHRHSRASVSLAVLLALKPPSSPRLQ